MLHEGAYCVGEHFVDLQGSSIRFISDTISRILNNTNTTLHQANRTVPNEDMMFIQISEANFAGQSNDAYTLAVRARNETIGVATNFIHISAKDVTGTYILARPDDITSRTL